MTRRPHLPNWLRPVTATGWLVAALGAAGWLAAWWLGWKELAVLAGACVAALALAVPFTMGKFNLQTALRLEPKRVIVGDRAGGDVVVSNGTSVRSMPMQVELTVGNGVAQFRIPSLAPGASHDELFTVPTQRRAVLQVGPVSSVRGDPLGLLRRERHWEKIEELFVHPHTVRLDRLGSGFLRDLEGQATNDLSPSDIAFHTLREYVPGDDRRHIHWRSSAKLDKLMVRQFVDTRRSELAILISEQRADYLDDEEFEMAVSLAASFGLRALRDEQTVHLVGGERRLPAVSGQSLLDGCSRLDMKDRGAGLSAAVGVANRLAPTATIVAFVTGSEASQADARQAASMLSTRGRLVMFRADSRGTLRRRVIGNLTTLDVPQLSDFERGLLMVLGDR